jgi:glycosyltransferase involved in cell wall biosynthesis
VGKRIWCISKYAAPLEYGYGHRLFSLAREFERLGHRVVVITSDSNHLSRRPKLKSTYTRASHGGVETWWIRTVRYGKSGSLKRIASWIDFEIKLWLMPKRKLPTPDVVIVSSLSLLTILNGYWLKRKYGSRLIFEIRDIWPLTLVEEAGFSRRNPLVHLLGWVERFGYAKADAIVGTMPNLAEHVREVYGEATDCYCIPLGYDPELYHVAEHLPEEYKDRYIPPGKFIVGYAGSIGTTNALDTLIQCAIEMKEDPSVHFLLVGEGALLDMHRERTAGLENVTFAPKVEKAQVQSVLALCQVLYFATEASAVWRFGQSLNKLIDYMMAGKPVIASYSGYPSMLDEADCGVFVPAKDAEALKRAIRDFAQMPSEELDRMGRRGRDWIRKNRPYGKIADEYARIL